MCEKYYSISPYAYCADNPVRLVDPDGRVITIHDINDRKSVLQMINSRAAGTFGINSKGNLYVIKKEGSSGFSTYYRDQLIKGINAKENIDIAKGQTYKENGVVKDVDKDAGGGVTLKTKETTTDSEGKTTVSKEASITISGNENTTLKDSEENPLQDQPADILMHELVGHGIPFIVGADTGNAVENENKARKELDPDNNCQRKQEPEHKE